MVYNVENLFDLVDNKTEHTLYRPDKRVWNNNAYQSKLTNISSVIVSKCPEIVALTEIENKNVLHALQKKMYFRGNNYQYWAIADQPHKTVTCPALLSKYPIKSTKTHESVKVGDYYSRNILEADIDIKGNILKVFVVHWPSKRHDEKLRVVAASQLMRIINNLGSDVEYIIVGDFNSNYNEIESVVNFHNGNDFITGINTVLQTVYKRYGSYIDYYKQDNIIGKGKHYNLWFELPSVERYNYIFKNNYNTLDNMLLPHTLFDTKGISYCDSSFRVYFWDGRLVFNDKPYRWQIVRSKRGNYHRGDGYSDHLPIYAQFTCNPFKSIKKSKNKTTILKKRLIYDFENIAIPSGNKRLRYSIEQGESKYFYVYGSVDSRQILFHFTIINDSTDTFNSGELSLKIKGKCAMNMAIHYGDSVRYYHGFSFKNITTTNKFHSIEYEEFTEIIVPLTVDILNHELFRVEMSVDSSTVDLALDDIILYREVNSSVSQ